MCCRGSDQGQKYAREPAIQFDRINEVLFGCESVGVVGRLIQGGK